MSKLISIRDIDEDNFEIELKDLQGQLRHFSATKMYDHAWSLTETTLGTAFFTDGSHREPPSSRPACIAAAKRYADANPPSLAD